MRRGEERRRGNEVTNTHKKEKVVFTIFISMNDDTILFAVAAEKLMTHTTFGQSNFCAQFLLLFGCDLDDCIALWKK